MTNTWLLQLVSHVFPQRSSQALRYFKNRANEASETYPEGRVEAAPLREAKHGCSVETLQQQGPLKPTAVVEAAPQALPHPSRPASAAGYPEGSPAPTGLGSGRQRARGAWFRRAGTGPSRAWQGGRRRRRRRRRGRGRPPFCPHPRRAGTTPPSMPRGRGALWGS